MKAGFSNFFLLSHRNSSLLVLEFLLVVSCNHSGSTNNNNIDSSCGFQLSAQGERVSWHTGKPIPLKVHTSIPENFFPAVQRAMDAWQKNRKTPLFVVTDWHYAGDPYLFDHNVIFMEPTWVRDPKIEDPLVVEQARTSSYIPDNRILSSRILLNASQQHFIVGRGDPNSGIDVASLILHELGHVLGFAHQKEGVMVETLKTNEIRDTLDDQTFKNLQCEYPL